MFVKICGITCWEDANVAIEWGADAVGFVFVSASPRAIDPPSAAAIARRLPPHVLRVGLFVDATLDRVRRIADLCELSLLQLHGDESPAYCRRVGRPVLKAFRVRDRASLAALPRYRVSAYLLDAYVEGKAGGTGQTFDWQCAVEAKTHGRIVLAGGLDPQNITDAITQVQPYGVDVSSGVERRPGRKDIDKVRLFVTRAKAASRGLH